jgi:hypothetical protein
MTVRSRVAAAGFALASLAPAAAHADEVPPEKAAEPSPAAPSVSEELARMREDAYTPTPRAPGSVALFDTRLAPRTLRVRAGPFSYRSAHDTRFSNGGFELRAGIGVGTNSRPFFMTGMHEMALRIFDPKSFAWTAYASGFASGVKLGPLEPEVQLGLGILTVDAFHGNYSAEILTPRVSCGGGLHLGRLRLDIQVHSEYLLRWFGPSYFVRGVTFGLQLDLPQPKGPDFAAK